jgi:signal transduction histidine kinase/ActR/RegA family two-component response regulator
VSGTVRPQLLGRIVVTPFITIGVLAAILVWEVEHVGSVLLGLCLTGGAVAVGVVVARRLRRNIDALADHYESLLQTADEQSRQAEIANRLKDEFLATVSHELRTPLNSVLGWSRLLASGKLDATQTVHAVESIERAGWAQSRLIEDLLDTSRIVSGKLQLTLKPTAVQPLIATAIDALRPAADAKQIAIAVTLDPSIVPLSADPDRLQQVVWNLVSNAVKFTPSGGRIDVRLTNENGQMCLSVKDTGIGFHPGVAAHLFERFRQGDSSSTRQYGGLGLGLGIVRHLIELHGGTVTASSAGEHAGSLFEVRLPIRIPDVPLIEAPLPVTHVPSLRGVSVLAVDDDPQALEFVRTTLEKYGATVVTAASAKEARDRFEREPTDVLLSDVLMPHEDGLQLIREIREIDDQHGRHTPAAALSSLARAEDRRRALRAGYEMHVAKPIDPADLVSTVERLAGAMTHGTPIAMK